MAKTLLFVLAFLVISHHSQCSIHQAGQCLKQLERNILNSAHYRHWRYSRGNFISAIDQIRNVSQIHELFGQLRWLESHVKYRKQTNSWQQWKRKYWKVMSDSYLPSESTVSQFIIALKFMEMNLLRETLNQTWKEDRRGEWLANCSNLVDPLHQLSFYDDLYLNVDTLLKTFGYGSLEEYDNEASKVISTVKAAAQALDKSARKAGIAQTTAGALSIASGVLGVVGIILVPISGGASLALVGISLTLGVASTTTSVSSTFYQLHKNTEALKKVISSTDDIIAETMALIQLLENYATSAHELKKKLRSIVRLKHMNRAFLKQLKAYTGKKALRMKQLVHQLNPHSVPNGQDTKFVSKFPAPGVKIPSWATPSNGVKIQNQATKFYSKGLPRLLTKGANSLTSAASSLSKFFHVLTVGFGIWEVLKGVKLIKNGSSEAMEFHKLAKHIDFAKRNILLAYDLDADLAFEENPTETLLDTAGRSEAWHRACFNGDRCVALALLSYEVTAFEAERICRRDSMYLFALGSQRTSDIIREWLSHFGRSVWFSTSSTFKEYDQGHPKSANGTLCVYFSATNDFLVRESGCNGIHMTAVLCA